MQISVDRMTPSPITKKSFKTILPKLDYFKDSKISLHITGVICADTLPESKAVLETGLARGIPTEVRLVHADPLSRYRVERGNKEELEAFIDSMIERKRRGEKIHTNEAILQYQKSLLRNEPVDWTCMAGYKLFFVSAQGKFWECSMVHSEKHIMDVTLDDLYANYRKKSCQAGCGVYCAVSTSLLVQKPASVISKEIVNRAKRIPGLIKQAVAPPEPTEPSQPAQAQAKVELQVSLSCEGIERYLGEDDSRVHALRGVSLQLERGTVHAVVGPSGCGKSTLLYILGLLDQADAGWVTIENEAVSHLVDDALARKRNELLGFIFQFHFLLEDFTAQENVMIPMRRLAVLTEEEMLERSAYLLEEVGLGSKRKRPSRHLSGREQQRVAVARSLANNPSIILADEPTGNLDSANSRRAFELLQRIVQEARN